MTQFWPETEKDILWETCGKNVSSPIKKQKKKRKESGGKDRGRRKDLPSLLCCHYLSEDKMFGISQYSDAHFPGFLLWRTVLRYFMLYSTTCRLKHPTGTTTLAKNQISLRSQDWFSCVVWYKRKSRSKLCTSQPPVFLNDCLDGETSFFLDMVSSLRHETKNKLHYFSDHILYIYDKIAGWKLHLKTQSHIYKLKEMNIPLVWRTMLLASMKSFQHGAYLAKEKQQGRYLRGTPVKCPQQGHKLGESFPLVWKQINEQNA